MAYLKENAKKLIRGQRGASMVEVMLASSITLIASVGAFQVTDQGKEQAKTMKQMTTKLRVKNMLSARLNAFLNKDIGEPTGCIGTGELAKFVQKLDGSKTVKIKHLKSFDPKNNGNGMWLSPRQIDFFEDQCKATGGFCAYLKMAQIGGTGKDGLQKQSKVTTSVVKFEPKIFTSDNQSKDCEPVKEGERIGVEFLELSYYHNLKREGGYVSGSGVRFKPILDGGGGSQGAQTIDQIAERWALPWHGKYLSFDSELPAGKHMGSFPTERIEQRMRVGKFMRNVHVITITYSAGCNHLNYDPSRCRCVYQVHHPRATTPGHLTAVAPYCRMTNPYPPPAFSPGAFMSRYRR